MAPSKTQVSPTSGSQTTGASVLRSYAEKTGWTLCVGAGTSLGAFPSWEQLAEQVFLAVRESGDLNVNLKEILRQFGPSAVIQAARNDYDGTNNEFAELLSSELFKDLKKRAGKDWDLVTFGLAARNLKSKPFKKTPQKWSDFLHLMERIGGGASCLALAKVLAETLDDNKVRPSSILSFNAEPLLYALINANYMQINGESCRSPLDRLSHDISSREYGRLPFVYVHGLLPIAGANNTFNNFVAATDKLVFTEAEYLRLAASAFSWQSTNFLFNSLNQHCVFIGVSMTDPNLRRWLSWEFESRRATRAQRGKTPDRHVHHWINVRPREGNEVAIIESMVKHLGIQVEWIDDWGEVGAKLREMLGMNDL